MFISDWKTWLVEKIQINGPTDLETEINVSRWWWYVSFLSQSACWAPETCGCQTSGTPGSGCPGNQSLLRFRATDSSTPLKVRVSLMQGPSAQHNAYLSEFVFVFPGKDQPISLFVGDVSSFTPTNLQPGTTYNVKVLAQYTTGFSAPLIGEGTTRTHHSADSWHSKWKVCFIKGFSDVCNCSSLPERDWHRDIWHRPRQVLHQVESSPSSHVVPHQTAPAGPWVYSAFIFQFPSVFSWSYWDF